MPGRRSKYSVDFNSEMKTALSMALLEAKEAVNIDKLKLFDMRLNGLTNQKAARLLNELVEQGFCVKRKEKSTGRVAYKAVGVMEEQGYEIGPDRGYDYSDKFEEYVNKRNNLNVSA